jgi:hypothetical protein
LSAHADSFSPELEQDMKACRELTSPTALEEPVSAEELAPIRDVVKSQVAEEVGLVSRLRALPTWQRIAMAFALSALVTIATAIATPRADMALYPSGHMLALLAAMATLTFAASWRLLRPLHRPPPSAWSGWALLVMGVAAPFIMSLIPLAHEGAAAGAGAAFAVGCAKCFGFGAALGLPVLLLAFLARRAHVDGAAVAALGGVAAGLTGNLTLQVHCPITDPHHLLLGHASLLVLLAGAAALWRRNR